MENPTTRDAHEGLSNPEQMFVGADEFLVAVHGESVIPKRKIRSLAAFRATMPFQETPSEALIREDRDARD
ncbi:MAG: type II toxin-antitoxin system Phd/YefM family antitoxin [Sulfuricella sp.]